MIVDPLPPQRVFEAIDDTARRYGLSACDAEYLELAAREDLPLATIDRQLRDAAAVAASSWSERVAGRISPPNPAGYSL